MSSDIFSRRGNVVERLLQERNCYREIHQDEKFSLKNLWRRMSFLEIVFKTRNLNQKCLSRRAIDNQIFFKTRKYWEYVWSSLVRFTFLVFPHDFTSECFRSWRYFCQHVWKIRKIRIFKHEEKGKYTYYFLLLSHVRNLKVRRRSYGVCVKMYPKRDCRHNVEKEDNIFCREVLSYLMRHSYAAHGKW